MLLPAKIVPLLLLGGKNCVRMRDEHNRRPARAWTTEKQVMTGARNLALHALRGESERRKDALGFICHRVHTSGIRREAVDADKRAQMRERFG